MFFAIKHPKLILLFFGTAKSMSCFGGEAIIDQANSIKITDYDFFDTRETWTVVSFYLEEQQVITCCYRPLEPTKDFLISKPVTAQIFRCIRKTVIKILGYREFPTNLEKSLDSHEMFKNSPEGTPYKNNPCYSVKELSCEERPHIVTYKNADREITSQEDWNIPNIPEFQQPSEAMTTIIQKVCQIPPPIYTLDIYPVILTKSANKI